MISSLILKGKSFKLILELCQIADVKLQLTTLLLDGL